MSSLVMPSGFVDMSETEMEYNDGGISLSMIGGMLMAAAVYVAISFQQSPVFFAAPVLAYAGWACVCAGGFDFMGQQQPN